MTLELTLTMIEKRNDQAFRDLHPNEVEIQDLICYGYIWSGGFTLTNAETDQYNRYTWESNMASNIDLCDEIRFARSSFLNDCLRSKT